MNLDQQGRAAMQFLGSLQVYSSSALQQQAHDDFERQPEAKGLAQEFAEDTTRDRWPDRLDRARDVAERSKAYRFNRLYQRYVAEEIWVKSAAAVERKRAELEPVFAAAKKQPSEKLKLDPALQIPDFYQGVEWHLQPGGMDGHDLYGPMFALGILPYVFGRGGFAAVAVHDNILQQRREVIKQFPKAKYRRIYEPGCGGAGTLGICRERFADAELIGGDFSARALRDGLAMSERMGWNIHFRQEDARHVAEPDNSVDGVISYAVHHELPESAAREVINEMYRILEPGGDMVISDPPPFRAVPPFNAALLAWEADNRGEPYFIESGITNLPQLMREAGFVDVEEYALQDTGYPWVTRGRKPAKKAG